MEEKMAILLLVLIAAVAVVQGQVFIAHRCQNVSAVQNFDVAKYLGLWYEYEKVNVSFESGGKCVTAEYTLKNDGTVQVHNKQVDSSSGKLKDIIGSASVDSSIGEGKLKVVFPTEGNIAAPYWVLSTDYTSYSVVWSCVSLGTRSVQFAWVLTRDKTPSDAVLETVNQVLKKTGLDELPFHRTAQTCN